MDQKTCRLVHREEILRFIQDLELNLILGGRQFPTTMIRLNRVTRIYSKRGRRHPRSRRRQPGNFLPPVRCGHRSQRLRQEHTADLLGGLDTPDSGEIWIGDLPLHNARDAELTRYRRHDLGIVFQFFNLLPAMTVGENVELPLLLRGERKPPTSG